MSELEQWTAGILRNLDMIVYDSLISLLVETGGVMGESELSPKQVRHWAMVAVTLTNSNFPVGAVKAHLEKMASARVAALCDAEAEPETKQPQLSLVP